MGKRYAVWEIFGTGGKGGYGVIFYVFLWFDIWASLDVRRKEDKKEEKKKDDGR